MGIRALKKSVYKYKRSTTRFKPHDKLYSGIKPNIKTSKTARHYIDLLFVLIITLVMPVLVLYRHSETSSLAKRGCLHIIVQMVLLQLD